METTTTEMTEMEDVKIEPSEHSFEIEELEKRIAPGKAMDSPSDSG